MDRQLKVLNFDAGPLKVNDVRGQDVQPSSLFNYPPPDQFKRLANPARRMFSRSVPFSENGTSNWSPSNAQNESFPGISPFLKYFPTFFNAHMFKVADVPCYENVRKVHFSVFCSAELGVDTHPNTINDKSLGPIKFLCRG